jgi:hypothetical protein
LKSHCFGPTDRSERGWSACTGSQALVGGRPMARRRHHKKCDIDALREPRAAPYALLSNIHVPAQSPPCTYQDGAHGCPTPALLEDRPRQCEVSERTSIYELTGPGFEHMTFQREQRRAAARIEDSIVAMESTNSVAVHRRSRGGEAKAIARTTRWGQRKPKRDAWEHASNWNVDPQWEGVAKRAGQECLGP